jgi:hypothetical protein
VPADGAGGAVYVELDGCQLILIELAAGGLVLAQADVALTALLDHQQHNRRAGSVGMAGSPE